MSLSTPTSSSNERGKNSGSERSARVWLQFFLAGFAVIFVLLSITVMTPVPYGDLSRIGRVSETEFGWRKPQPDVTPELLKGATPAEGDILVIGDSFSMTYRWQSALTKAGYRVVTAYWGDYSEAMCLDFSDWIKKNGFEGKLVILESVERLLSERLEKSMNCAQMRRPLISLPKPYTSPPHPSEGIAKNWGAKLNTGVITYLNTRDAIESPGDTPAGKRVWSRPVPDGCEFFSHRLCNKALFYGEDDERGPLTPTDLSRLQAFTATQPRIHLLWMVIPNKTSVYLKPESSTEFASALGSQGLGPDLFSFVRAERPKVRDLYYPNDSHLSAHGQLVLGERMLEEVRKRLPAPRSARP